MERLELARSAEVGRRQLLDRSGVRALILGCRLPFRGGLSGRIVAIADVFDALTHDRPYKEAWPLAKAVEEIESLAGRQFDPQVVEAFERLSHAELLTPDTSSFEAAA
jgi:HD domain-containing protein